MAMKYTVQSVNEKKSYSKVHLLAMMVAGPGGWHHKGEVAEIALTACGEILTAVRFKISTNEPIYKYRKHGAFLRKYVVNGLSCSTCAGVQNLLKVSVDVTDDIIPNAT